MASTNNNNNNTSDLERFIRLNVELEQRVRRRENLIQDLDYKISEMTEKEKTHLKEIQEANTKISQLSNEKNESQLTNALQEKNEQITKLTNELGEKEKKIQNLNEIIGTRPTTTETPLATAFSHLVIMFVIIGFLQSLLS